MKRIKLPTNLDKTYTKRTHIKSGISEFDNLFYSPADKQHGLPIGAQVAMYGTAGSGKTTEVLRLLDGFTGQGCFTTFLSREMQEQDIQALCLKMNLRAGIHSVDDNCDKSSYDMLVEAFGYYTFIMKKERIRQAMPFVIGVDSIELLGEDLRSVRNQFTMMRKFAVDNRITQFFIGHLDDNGTTTGPRKVIRQCDAEMKVTRKGNVKTVSMPGKNRFGEQGETAVYRVKIPVTKKA